MIHDTLQSRGEKLPLISVIIPVYNAQDYLSICIQSVLDQTYQNFEIICVDDGATDGSAEVIKRLAYNDPRIQLIQIENHGQGYARNLGLSKARGEYILFLDADDFIEPVTLDLSVTRAEEDKSDFVLFDWRYYSPISLMSNYCNVDEYFSERILEGESRFKLLPLLAYFTVNKLYRRSFLEAKNIKYAEGYLYEDIPYWIKAVVSASKVSLIHSPLYRITISQTSSTKTNLDTDVHYKSYLQAVSDSIAFLNSTDKPLNEITRYYVASYFLQKFIYYYLKRTPKRSRRDFRKRFVDLMSELDPQNYGEWRLLSVLIKRQVFRKRSYGMFALLFYLAAVCKPAIERCVQRIKKIGKKVSHSIREKQRKLSPFKRDSDEGNAWEDYNKYLRQPLYSNVVLFMGFDFRYTGNSRYLFEEMVKKSGKKRLLFVTDSPLVPAQYRLEPNSARCVRFIARAKTLIFESWAPAHYTKRAGATWIQLWHGTPLKRMLFDSHEKEIITKNPTQKVSKFKDISRWGYLLVDNPNVATFFQTAFLFPKERMLLNGYPRVKYLLQKKDDQDYKNMLRDIYQIPVKKKVVLYLPTWRDYNYKAGENSGDMSYFLDIPSLQATLGEEYVVICKDHAFLSLLDEKSAGLYQNAETQELLLIADYLITDYSSVMFDAFAVDIPVILYCTDFEKNEASRGVYPEIWNDVSPLNCETLEDVIARIKNYGLEDICRKARDKYSYKMAEAEELSTFIENI